MRRSLFKKLIGGLSSLILSYLVFPPISIANAVWYLQLKDFDNPTRTIEFPVYPGHSVNIILIPSGMAAKVAWLDDLSYFGLSFDGVLCEKNADNACTPNQGKADVIHLTLHKNIYEICYLPPDPNLFLSESEIKKHKRFCDPGSHNKSRKTSLTLLVEGQGKKKVLVFDLIPKIGKEAPMGRVTKIYVTPNKTSPLVSNQNHNHNQNHNQNGN
ncbi:MAG: hypothetical protein ACFBSE_02355 [Prochloraceae cyanobacterium]